MVETNPHEAWRRRYSVWSVSDDALLAGLGTGDAEAAAAFVRRFQRRVYGLALTRGGAPSPRGSWPSPATFPSTRSGSGAP
jgi:hypothetical protein